MTAKNEELLALASLSPDVLTDIEQLARICSDYEGDDIKLNWSMLRSRSSGKVNDFLFYERGRLVGYLPIFDFGGREVEISGMVHPHFRRRGVFSRLLNAALQECRHREVERVMFIVEHSSEGGQIMAQRLGTQYHHSEYKMLRRSNSTLTTYDSSLFIRSATTAADIRALIDITAQAFNVPYADVNWYTHQTLERSDRRYYIVSVNEQYVGKIDVLLMPEEAWIVGLAVIPDYRGCGYGRALLSYTINEILKIGRQSVLLEVEMNNERALSLYTSCGFQIVTRYDYYTVSLT